MKAVILAGGFGSRLSEETAVRPKPMVEFGGKPMLWHSMKIYAAHGVGRYLKGEQTVWEQEPMRSLCPRRPACVLPPRGVLAGDGYAA